MSDLEVEATLSEIRRRVRAEAAERRAVAPREAFEGEDESNDTGVGIIARGENGDRSRAGYGGEHYAGESLARMDANLATTARAYARLPPIESYRSGLAARIELYVKRLVKRAAHWFTWEQVNFNAGAHQALRDAHAALAAHERMLAQLKADIFAIRDEMRASVAQLFAAAEAERARTSAQTALLEEHSSLLNRQATSADELSARLASESAALRERFEAGIAEIARSQAARVESLSDEVKSLRDERLLTRIESLESEMRERDRNLLEEQRVLFRQLSLEAAEAAVGFDRARRLLEQRLEQIEEMIAERR